MEPLSARFLVLDDQMVLRKLIARQAELCARQAVDIDEYSDPMDALRSLEERDYDLIITDIGLPGMNGIDFIKSLALLGYRGALLVVSGYDEKMLKAIAQMAERLGMREARYLCKPYAQDAFASMLGELESGFHKRARAGLDVPLLLGGLHEQSFRLRLEPALSLQGRSLLGFFVDTVVVEGQAVSISSELFSGLTERAAVLRPVLELLVERIAQLQQRCPPGCLFELPIDAHCLGMENIFDGCGAILHRYGMQAQQLGFALADGLLPDMPALVYENIAKIRYLGMRLTADRVGEGSLTMANLFRLPLDQLNLSMATMRRIRQTAGEDAPALRLLRLFGLGLGAACVYGVDEAEDWRLACLSGCQSGRGRHLAPELDEQDLTAFVREQIKSVGLASI